MKIELTDERNDLHETFHYENGIEAFVAYLNEEKETLHSVISLEGEQNGIEVDLAFQFNDGYSENILSFVNNVRTKDGGTHEIGAKTAMTRAFNDYARKMGSLRKKIKTSKVPIYEKAYLQLFLCVSLKNFCNLKDKPRASLEQAKPVRLLIQSCRSTWLTFLKKIRLLVHCW